MKDSATARLRTTRHPKAHGQNYFPSMDRQTSTARATAPKPGQERSTLAALRASRRMSRRRLPPKTSPSSVHDHLRGRRADRLHKPPGLSARRADRRPHLETAGRLRQVQRRRPAGSPLDRDTPRHLTPQPAGAAFLGKHSGPRVRKTYWHRRPRRPDPRRRHRARCARKPGREATSRSAPRPPGRQTLDPLPHLAANETRPVELARAPAACTSCASTCLHRRPSPAIRYGGACAGGAVVMSDRRPAPGARSGIAGDGRPMEPCGRQLVDARCGAFHRPPSRWRQVR